MSTIQTHRNWQPEPTKILVKESPVEEGKSLIMNEIKCIICSSHKAPCIFDENKNPLVLKCVKCGHKSWATSL